jgi:O-antigen ligase
MLRLPAVDWRDHVARRSLTLQVAMVAAIAGAAAVAASQNALLVVLAGVLALAAAAGALINPNILFYAYCAAIPLNDILPPGPAGTVGRIAGLVFFVGYLVRRPGSLRVGLVPLVGWLYVGWALASTLWAIDTDTSVDAWISIGQLFGITVLIASIVAEEPALARRGVLAYLSTATATAVIAALPAVQGSVAYLSRASAFGGQNPAGFASLLVPAVMFLMSESQSRDNRGPIRALFLAALVACVMAVGLSGTRSAWLGITGAIAAWVVLKRESRQFAAVAAVGVGVLLLVAVVPGASDFLLERTGTSVESGGSGRTDIWAVGLQIFANAPIFGVGFGNFPLAFTPTIIAEVAGAHTGGAGRDPHNVLLGAFVETGLIGGALLIAFFGTAWLRLRGDGLAIAVRAALFGLFVESLFLETLLRKHVWLLIALALGLAAQRAEVPWAKLASLRSDRLPQEAATDRSAPMPS